MPRAAARDLAALEPTLKQPPMPVIVSHAETRVEGHTRTPCKGHAVDISNEVNLCICQSLSNGEWLKINEKANMGHDLNGYHVALVCFNGDGGVDTAVFLMP